MHGIQEIKGGFILGVFVLIASLVGSNQLIQASSDSASPHLFEAWEQALEEAQYVDINTADIAAWERLPGIGPTRAKKIVNWRQQNGPWNKIEDLKEVPGIGTITFKRILPYLKLNTKTEQADG